MESSITSDQNRLAQQPEDFSLECTIEPSKHKNKPPRIQKPTAHKQSATRDAIWRRLRKFHNPKYQQLLERHVRDFYTETYYNQSDDLDASQLGMIQWNSDEKEAFFEAVTRYGRLDHPTIANIVGKSVYEIQDYELLLEKGLHDSEDGFDLHPAELHSAVEINPQCEAMLNRAAEAFAHREFNATIKKAKDEHGDIWLIDQETVTAVEEAIEAGGEAEQSAYKILPAAKLLHIGNWIETSKKIFMNSGGPAIQSNWTRIASKKESPSMMFEALDDLHQIALSLTGKIVQSSLEIAEERCRRSGAGEIVHKEDVYSALDCMKLQHSAVGFWVEAARRHNITVRTDRWPIRELSPHEVEEILSAKLPAAVKSNYAIPEDNDDDTDDVFKDLYDRKFELSQDDDIQDAETEDHDAQLQQRTEEDILQFLDRPLPEVQKSDLEWVSHSRRARSRPNTPGSADVERGDRLYDFRQWNHDLLFQSEWESFDAEERASIEQEITRNHLIMRRKEHKRLQQALAPSAEAAPGSSAFSAVSADAEDTVISTDAASDAGTTKEGSMDSAESDGDGEDYDSDEAQE